MTKSLQEIFLECEIVSLHIHADDNNINLINKSTLQAQSPTILVNTSREIVNERDIVHSEKNINSIYVTDVIANEASLKKVLCIIKIYQSTN